MKLNQVETVNNIHIKLVISLFYLRSCWAAVGPLVPGFPSLCFPPLHLTLLRPFLLVIYLLLSPLTSLSPPGCLRRKWSRVTTETPPFLLPFHRLYHPVHPDKDNFTARKHLQGSVTHFGSVFNELSMR